MTIKLRTGFNDNKINVNGIIIWLSTIIGILIIFITFFHFLSTPVEVGGSLECAIDGQANDDSGKLRIHEINNIHCSGTFKGKIPLSLILSKKE
jgi:hypothetical protein